MGNEGSHLSGLEIEETPVEVTDFWAHYQATIKDSCRYFSLKSDGSVSVFKGEAVVGPLWVVSTPLEKFSNNLLKYRHPCIIRYISAWQQRSTMHLATEYVQPLSQVLNQQSPLQRCIGLNNILRALVFLNEQAGLSHNNISVSTIYVTGDNQWKLGGLQYLCPFSELSSTYLKNTRKHRYDKAVDPNEDSYEDITKVDQYAFSILVEDVYKGCKYDDVPHLLGFKKYCFTHLQSNAPSERLLFSKVLQHNFFNHEFISIYKFLNFLALKSDDEKQIFFSTILNSLRCYDEDTVAKQLSGLLLSRLALLDETARKHVIPHILKPKNEKMQNEEMGLFCDTIFKEHIKPKLMQLFAVRDTQIRLLLLSHFTNFVHVFSHDEISQQILPELLLGIKDTDDELVGATLICLSELIPILGADTVVGGKRSKLFSDGRPNSKNNSLHSKQYFNIGIPSKTLKDLACSENVFHDNENQLSITLNERPSPVGGEADAVIDNGSMTKETTKNTAESEEDWSDWDTKNQHLHAEESTFGESLELTVQEHSIKPESHSSLKLQSAAIKAKQNIVDISDLDIKNQKFESKSTEFDFFADMKPVIEKAAVINVNAVTSDLSNKLKFVPEDGSDSNEGWGEDWN